MNYNHALCVWRPAALARIYALAAQHLVQQRHYPDAVLDLKCACADVGNAMRPACSVGGCAAVLTWPLPQVRA